MPIVAGLFGHAAVHKTGIEPGKLEASGLVSEVVGETLGDDERGGPIGVVVLGGLDSSLDGTAQFRLAAMHRNLGVNQNREQIIVGPLHDDASAGKNVARPAMNEFHPRGPDLAADLVRFNLDIEQICDRLRPKAGEWIYPDLFTYYRSISSQIMPDRFDLPNGEHGRAERGPQPKIELQLLILRTVIRPTPDL